MAEEIVETGLPSTNTHAASASTREYGIYRHLAEQIPPLGFAAFVYDRRGSGASGGDAQALSLDILADDAIAAQRALSKEPEIDARRIGLWGLSQGGWLAILAASRNPATAFVVSISGPAVTPARQMNFATANLLALKGADRCDIEQAIRTRSLVDDFLRGCREARGAGGARFHPRPIVVRRHLPRPGATRPRFALGQGHGL